MDLSDVAHYSVPTGEDADGKPTFFTCNLFSDAVEVASTLQAPVYYEPATGISKWQVWPLQDTYIYTGDKTL